MTHTPEPWHVAADDCNGQAVVSSEHTEICTCWHHCVGALEKEMRDNARLIAKAPELLTALQNLIAAYAMSPLELAAKYGPDAHPDEAIIDACSKAQAIIQQATNQS